ncbi:MAG: thiamine pyrophosphate-binding protein [Candidatus Limnocylindrales bacterium]
MTTGSRLLAQTLRAAGVRIVSGIPGHTVFPFANGITEVPGLEPFLVRHEAISAFAADVYFRVTGELMAVFAHSLPGVSNMVAGIANAYADSSAMIVIVGETATEASGRGAYQELARSFDGDVPQLLRHITKRSWQVRTPSQLVEHTLRAVKVATSGRPGPVALHVSQEVWDQDVDVPSPTDVGGFLVRNAFRPTAEAVDRAADMLSRAERPLLLAGNGVILSRAQTELVSLAERLNAPVATTVSGKGAFPEDHPLSVGVIGWVGTAPANFAGRRADVVLAIGARLTEVTTSSWQPDASFNFPTARLIQCDVEPVEIANVFPVDVALVGDARHTLVDLIQAVPMRAGDQWLQDVAAEKRIWRSTTRELADSVGDPRPVGPVVAALRAATEGAPVTIVCDIGKHAKWIAQQFEARRGDTIISSMGAGTMGIGPCGAVGAALALPNSRTIAWVGDGGMAMSAYVLPTAAEHQLPIAFVVIDDRAFGEIVNIQEQRFGRTIFSEFNAGGRNPEYSLDLATLAAAAGVPSQRVGPGDNLRAAMDWALSQQGPVLLDILVDRKSRVPSAGGFKLTDVWNHPIHPWARGRES